MRFHGVAKFLALVVAASSISNISDAQEVYVYYAAPAVDVGTREVIPVRQNVTYYQPASQYASYEWSSWPTTVYYPSYPSVVDAYATTYVLPAATYPPMNSTYTTSYPILPINESRLFGQPTVVNRLDTPTATPYQKPALGPVPNNAANGRKLQPLLVDPETNKSIKTPASPLKDGSEHANKKLGPVAGLQVHALRSTAKWDDSGWRSASR